MAKPSQARAFAGFKQLCCMGLGREAVTPALLGELRTLVPNLSSLAFFIDEDGKLDGGYTDNPEAIHTGPLYMREFHGRRDRELGGAFPDAVRTQFGVHDFAQALGAIKIDLHGFERSDFYNLIYRPQRLHWFMRLMVRDRGGRGRALASVTMYRGSKDRPWTHEEKRRLASLEPFLAHALREGSAIDGPLVESGQTGTIVADTAGRPVHFTSAGRRLLQLVTHPRVAPDTDFAGFGQFPPAVVRICRDLSRIFADDPVSAVAPTYHHRNVWGGFRFSAAWLDGADQSGGLIAITITHEEPLPVKLMRRVGELPLSRRQAEVCFLMASGASREVVAERLGITRNTAITHGRWIYNKLDVHNRAELINRLLAT
jgi:DNA-binding CsgD family transcriptional regulator